MADAMLKLLLIPAFTLSAGLFFSLFNGSLATINHGYPEHLTGAFTGGFGEKTCHSCHFDYDLNWGEGSLSISGVPDNTEAGTWYVIEIEVERPGLGKAGFQLSSRFPNGSQAGHFEISDNERLMLTKHIPDSLQYVQHSEKGTAVTKKNASQWAVMWKAPSSIPESIIFNISANAANGDESEFGDWIYIQELVVNR